ncbi:MAG: hypothetical protein ACE5FQ_01830 [Thiogranum sp.]
MDLKCTSPANEKRPRLAVRVGFVGHRDPGECDTVALQETIRSVLYRISRQLGDNHLAWGYNEESPVCYLVNSLAEGTDQLAAEVSRQLEDRYQLRIPVPFSPDIYTACFQYEPEKSRATFARLAGCETAAVINLDCPHATAEQRSRAYRTTADLLLENSDILIAVCDLQRPQERGGTVETVRRAERINIPVILIDPNSPATPMLVICDEEQRCEYPLEILEQQLCNILAPHFPEQTVTRQQGPGDRLRRRFLAPDERAERERKKREQCIRRERFFAEPLAGCAPGLHLAARVLHLFYAPWWRSVHYLGQFAVQARVVMERLAGGGRGRQDDAAIPRAGAHESAILHNIRKLQEPYAEQRALSDRLAGFYMELYRGSFALNFMLGAFAVLFALFSYFNPVNEILWLWSEIGALFLIATNFLIDRWWHWRERAIEYRFLAEHFRHMEALSPLVRVTPLTRMPVHNRHGDPDATWMNWYFRALVRHAGLLGPLASGPERKARTLNLDRNYVGQVHRLLQEEWLEGQRNYHAHVAHRFRFIGVAVRTFTVTLFVVTVGACFAHLFHVTPVPEDVVAALGQGGNWREGALLTILVAALPAFLAAFHGLSKQGEFERLTERSEAMADHLGHMGKRFAGITPGSERGYAASVANRAVDISRMMLEEMLEWRVIYLAHATELT